MGKPRTSFGRALFEYNGPFYHFNTVQGRGEYYTYAKSYEQARCNILYQYKMMHGYKASFKLDLDMEKLKAVTE